MSSAAATHQLTTWNSQGNAGSKDKLTIIRELTDRPAVWQVMFLQEGGASEVNLKELADRFDFAAGQGVGAKNERCTPYVLCDKRLKGKALVLTDAKGGALIAGGEAGRTAAAMMVGRTLFVSWHSTADMKPAGTADLIGALLRSPAYAKAFDTIVVGGDFNAEPDKIIESMAALTGAARAEIKGYKLRSFDFAYEVAVWASGVKTQGGTKDKRERQLDYFIVLTTKASGFLNVSAPAVTAYDASDHSPVKMDCRITS